MFRLEVATHILVISVLQANVIFQTRYLTHHINYARLLYEQNPRGVRSSIERMKETQPRVTCETRASQKRDWLRR